MADYSEIDLAIALQLQAQFEEERRVHLLNSEKLLSTKNADLKNRNRSKDGELHETEQEKLSVSLIDPTWELLDPNPKIHDLFLIFNDQFFWGRLSGIAVSWSPRMTLCAGVCSYERRGGLCHVRLSVPLLKLRPRKDLVETLLHEMIHAYLFVTKNDTDHDGHGPQFHKHMYRINKIAGTKISVYHQFHDEVDVYRQHIWLCDGPCRKRRPYFGLVKRSMNRTPSERDPWWEQHRLNCGGTYTKIKEPEGYGVKSKKIKVTNSAALNSKTTEDIRKFFTPTQDPKSGSANNENLKKPLGSNINRLDISTNGTAKIVKKTGNIHEINLSLNSKSKNSSVKKKAVPRNFKTKSPSNQSTSKMAKGGAGSGLGMRKGTSGSTTVTVGQWQPSSETKDSSTNVASTYNFTPFVGQGHSLGGVESNVGVSRSRLLSLQNLGNQIASRPKSTSNTHYLPMHNSVISPQLSMSEDDVTNSQSSEDEDIKPSNHVKCPLCRKELNSSDFDHHISLCLGCFDECDQNQRDSDSGILNNGFDISSSSVRKSSGDDAETITTELDDSVIIVNSSDYDTLHSTTQFEETLHPCPVCNKSFSESTITKHVNQHFS